jgi:hypothetical protein
MAGIRVDLAAGFLLLMANKWTPLEDTICFATLLTYPACLMVCFVV